MTTEPVLSLPKVCEIAGNGFTFAAYNAHDMLYAISRAVDLYKDEKAWHDAVIHAMKCDFSWSVSAKVYVDMYQAVLDR